MSESTSLRKRVTLERVFQGARAADVWELWTTKDGLESWWGPDGFSVEVYGIDLRVKGQLDYVMTAHAPDQIEFLRKAGMPLSTRHVLIFTEVVPLRRLAYLTTVDFVPGVRPYEVTTAVELESTATGIRLALTFDVMHDAHWTQLATAGWENELDKLARALGRR